MCKQRFQRWLYLAVFAWAAVAVQLTTVYASPEWDAGDSAELYIRSSDPADYTGRGWETSDSNGDGTVDYVVLSDADGLKVQEAYDYSGDGKLDDYYFYDEGKLVIREVDSTDDGQIDIWVRLYDGHLISEVQRDTTGDGDPDYVRTYEDE